MPTNIGNSTYFLCIFIRVWFFFSPHGISFILFCIFYFVVVVANQTNPVKINKTFEKEEPQKKDGEKNNKIK